MADTKQVPTENRKLAKRVTRHPLYQELRKKNLALHEEIDKRTIEGRYKERIEVLTKENNTNRQTIENLKEKLKEAGVSL